jgi:hypothetical protein
MRKSHCHKVADRRRKRLLIRIGKFTDRFDIKFVSDWMRRQIEHQFNTMYLGGTFLNNINRFEDNRPLTYDMLLTTAKEIDRQMPLKLHMLKSRCDMIYPQPVTFKPDWSCLKLKEIDIADF